MGTRSGVRVASVLPLPKSRTSPQHHSSSAVETAHAMEPPFAMLRTRTSDGSSTRTGTVLVGEK